MSFNAIFGSCFQVWKVNLSFCGVETNFSVRAILDDAETVEDSVNHWLPVHQDTAVAGRASVELRSRKDWGPTEEGEKKIVRNQTDICIVTKSIEDRF